MEENGVNCQMHCLYLFFITNRPNYRLLIIFRFINLKYKHNSVASL